METQPGRMVKLKAGTGILTVALYMIGSIVAGLIAVLFFGGLQEPAADARNIDTVIDNTMIANFIVLAGLLYAALWVFRASRHRIFFEERAINRPRYYYLIPAISAGVALFALTQVNYAAFTAREILLVVIASLIIGINEELVVRGILLVGLRNSGLKEWLVWLLTLIVFSAAHLVNLVAGGASPVVLIIVLTGGTLWYASRRIFGNLFVPIALHALHDTAFYLLSGAYPAAADLPDHVLDIQLASFLVMAVGSVLVLFVGRSLFQRETDTV